MRKKTGLNVSFSLEEEKAPKVVHKDKKTANEGVALTPEESNYLLPHFTMLVVGKPGSGKTTVIRDLLTSK